MSRQKTVFSPDMVAHLWANGRAEYARNAGGTFHTQNGLIFSYGDHFAIGAFCEDETGQNRLFWNTSRYSNTTARHQSTAWRALNATQRNNAFDVAGMSGAFVTPAGKRESAESCVAAALAKMEKAEKARSNRASYLNSAGSYLKSARVLFRIAGDISRAESLPFFDEHTSAEEVRAYVLAINREKYLTKAREFLKDAQSKSDYVFSEVAQFIERAAAGTVPDRTTSKMGREYFYTPAQNVARRAVDFAHICRYSAESYAKAGVKNPPALVRLAKKARDCVASMEPHVKAEKRAENLRDALARENEAARALAIFNRSKKQSSDYKALNWEVSKLIAPSERAYYLELIPHAMPMIDRIRAIDAAGVLMRGIETARARLIDWADEQKRRNYTPLAVTQFDGGLTILEQTFGPAARAYWRPILQETIDAVKQNQAEWAEYRQHLQAAEIDEWRAGGRVSGLHLVPVMARIRGGNVETSRGAVVPLEHAARLVRIARRVALRGGQKWADGAGPIVGHFRVNRIGADFSATIGCHEFSSEESARIIAEIEKTPVFAITPETAE